MKNECPIPHKKLAKVEIWSMNTFPMDSTWLEKLVYKYFKKEWNFQENQENCESHNWISVDQHGEERHIDGYLNLISFWLGETNNCPPKVILDFLCTRKVIPEGVYLIGLPS